MVTFALVEEFSAAIDSRATTEHFRVAMGQCVIEEIISEDFNQLVTSKIQEAFAAELFRSALDCVLPQSFGNSGLRILRIGLPP